MDAKDLRIEPALSECSRDVSKYNQNATVQLQCNKNKSYQDMRSNPSAKVETPTARPCAIIGPDRVVPPTEPNDTYLKKAQVEPWPCPETVYHRPPEYPHKPAATFSQTRNISPRQTFQENMQRIMVPPTYNSVKANEEATFIQKLSVTSDAKYRDVPYSVNTTDSKNTRSADMCLPNVNSALGRPPHGWNPNGIGVHLQRPYVSSDVYQYPDYPSCAGPRPVSISRPHRNIPEESGYIYPEHYYQESNIRFKPYPNVKERYPQPRYDYVTNYPNPFHPPPCAPQISKALPPHPYSGYPHLKYVDSRMPESILEGYQRPIGQQGSYNIAYRNQIMHPAYGPVINNNSESKIPPYPPEGNFKAVASNKIPYESNSKIYVEFDNVRTKQMPPHESFYPNEMSRHHAIMKGAVPNYPSINVHTMPPHSYYKKEHPQIKTNEYLNHYKNLNPSINMNSTLQHLIPQYSPNTIAISPSDSNISNDTSQTHGISQEDCGYVSQSSSTSIRSIDLGNARVPNAYYGRFYDPRYGPGITTVPTSKTNRNGNIATDKEKTDMDVRKFLQMWNEGDDDNTENISSKESIVQNNSNTLSNTTKPHGIVNNHDQLYVLGLVNVSNEELSKYEHIQKVSKLPENIKGYNSIELLNQFEEVIESSNMNGFKLSTSKEIQAPIKQCASKQSIVMLPRPISPLDVEAKISQSVIHKEVGCNFEIKPCSPKMLNVEIASPVQNILNERVIEKVTNPLSIITSPIVNGIDNLENCKIPNARQDHQMLKDSESISSCNMINTQFSNSNPHSIKTNYSIQDLESNAGVCLASLPRLDNDIELSFPEVNQQFINANKSEPVMTAQIKDLPELGELNQTGKLLNIKPDNLKTRALSPKIETEREFTKLSKYRKIKTNIHDGILDKFALKAIRTDSVIIKNPENANTLEIDNELHRTNTNKQIDQQICNNLTLDLVEEKISSNNISDDTKANRDVQVSTDVAIDFSFKIHKNADKSFELEHNIKKIDSIQTSEEFLNKNLHENKDEELKCSEIYQESKLSKETNSEISSTEDVTVPNYDSSTPHMASLVSSSKMGHLCEPYIEKNHAKSNLLHIPEIFGKRKNPRSKILKPVPVGKSGNNIVQMNNKSNKETLVHLHIEDNVSRPNDDLIKKDILDVVTCEVSYGQCKVIRPVDNMKIVNSVEAPKNEVTVGEVIADEVIEHMLHNEYTTTSDTTKIPIVKDIANEVNEHMLHNESTTVSYATKLPIVKDIANEVNDHMSHNKPTTPSDTVKIPVVEEMANEVNDHMLYKKSTTTKSSVGEDIENEVDEYVLHNESTTTYNTTKISVEGDIVNKANKPVLDNESVTTSDTTKISVGEDIVNKVNKPVLDNEAVTTSDTTKIPVGEDIVNKVNKPVLDNESATTPDATKIIVGEEITKEINKHMIHNESATTSDIKSLNEKKKTSSDFQETVDNLNEIFSEHLDPKEFSHSEIEDISEIKHNTLTKMCNLDEGFVSIDEIQNCDNEAVYSAEDNDLSCKNHVNADNINESMQYVSKCFGYGSKELYSPWIQKLIMFDEGVSNAIPFNEDKASLLEVDNILGISKLIDSATCTKNADDCIPKNADDCITEVPESTVYGSTCHNTSSDSMVNNKNYTQIEISTLSPSRQLAHCKQLNLQIKHGQDFLDIQDHLSQNIQSDEDLQYKESDRIKEVICEQDENNINTPEVDYCIQTEKKSSRHKLDIKKQSTEIHGKNATDRDENISKIVPIISNRKHQVSLKRSLSDSALSILHNESQAEHEDFSVIWPFKHRKLIDTENESEMIAQNLCNILEHNRRNSISAVYNEDVSFCILIEDNSIITQENDEGEKICYTELSEDCLNEINNAYTCEENNTDLTTESVTSYEQSNCEYSNNITLNDDHNIALDGTWIENVGCMETVVSDDIAEDIVISSVSTRKENNFWINDESNTCVNTDEESDAVADSPKYDEEIINNPQIFKLCETPIIDNDNILTPRASHSGEIYMGLYDNDSLEKILSESNSQDESPYQNIECPLRTESSKRIITPDDKENMHIGSETSTTGKCLNAANKIEECSSIKSYEKIKDDVTVYSCESSIDNDFSYNKREDIINYSNSSSPEVSSTTSDDKASSLLLKITNYKGTKISQINTIKTNNNKISCKYTEKTDYVTQNAKTNSNRPLLTKAAQKYIPPIKESIRDLKVKLSLPQHSLLKLKQMKTSKDEPKLNKHTTVSARLPKKPKPKFEDVLKSIDEIQIKMHKEKTKKIKKSIPKVVIKKNENGSHYASTSIKDKFNPDLTGRKWQPWVFLEKNNFIDKMATRKKTKAIFSHRKNTFVLAEKFHKYKSASSTKFIISHPKRSDSSTGQLKYTIKLKHSY